MVQTLEQAQLIVPKLKSVRGLHPVGFMVYALLEGMAGWDKPVETVWWKDVPQLEVCIYRFIQGKKTWEKAVTYAELMAMPIEDSRTHERGATWKQTLGQWMREAAERLGNKIYY